jgi:DNA repair protein RAD5
MGKTCMMASLIHLNREGDIADPDSSPPVEDEHVAKRPKFKQVTLSNQWRAVPTVAKAASTPRATLVVCPVSLASQWHEELGKMSEKGSLTSFMWYGNDRVDVERLLSQEGKKKVDVVITSYGTLASEFQKWWKNKDKPSYEGGSIFDRKLLLPKCSHAKLIGFFADRTGRSAQYQKSYSHGFESMFPPKRPTTLGIDRYTDRQSS